MKRITSMIPFILVTIIAMPAFSDQPADHSKPLAPLTNEQVMGIIAAVDDSEIAAAKMAKTKKITANIIQYANYLLKQHQQNLDQLKKLERKTGMTAMQSAQSIAIANSARSEAAMLNSLNDEAFESAYMDAMVKGHAGGLELIDNVLLKDSTNAKLKKFVASFRALVARHLEKGQKIQAMVRGR